MFPFLFYLSAYSICISLSIPNMFDVRKWYIILIIVSYETKPLWTKKKTYVLFLPIMIFYQFGLLKLFFSTPAPGFYNDDDVPDVLIKSAHGPGFPVYYYSTVRTPWI